MTSITIRASLHCVRAAVLSGGCLLGLIVWGCDRGGQKPDLVEPAADHVPSLRQSGPQANAATADAKLELAFQSLNAGRLDQALALVQDILIVTPEQPSALQLAIEIHSRRGDFCQAAELAAVVAEFDLQTATEVLIRAFDWNLRCGDFYAAEANLNRAVAIDPSKIQVHRLLAQLLNSQGRRYESSRHVMELIRRRAVQPNEVLSLVDLQGPFYLVNFSEIAKAGGVTLFDLGAARNRYTAANEEPGDVLETVQAIRTAFPDSAAAAAFHGRLLAESGRQAEIDRWLTDLPTGIEDHPEYWYAIGTWMVSQNRHDEAVRAYGEALRRDPGDRESLRSMIHSLDVLGNEVESAALRNQLAVLDQLFRIAKDADAEQALWISQRLQDLARPLESSAWLIREAQISGLVEQKLPELMRRHDAIMAWESKASEDQIRAAQLIRLLGFEIEQWPLPELKSHGQSIAASETPSLGQGLKFVDVAVQQGMDIRYVGGMSTDGQPFYPYQVNGAGIAVIDYDLDGRMEFYLVQSGGSPLEPLSSQPNQLMRSIAATGFQDCAEKAGAADRRFGQGVCCGDVNQDGMPDLVVANIGANVLLINQGDGTFRDASDRLPSGGADWTSCIAVADIDGDALPEIIEVNYIDDANAYHVRCTDDYLNCQPQRFTAASDRVLQGAANGTFTPWLPAQAMRADPKLGFGLVIANFDRRFGNDFFIANDGDLNHYWQSVEGPDPDVDRYSIAESAGIRGCSIGRGGDSQACMGVAAGDFDRDGTLDLHVTNFYHEAVNLFTQTRSGFFSDQALQRGLVDASFGVLGFGTQAADFDHDGWLDLAVLNGHVFNASGEGIPFQMQPQLFHGGARGFQLQPAETSDAYWQQKQLGRTLAIVDWNRDGRMDLIASHLDLPVALLENSSAAGNWVQIELIGTRSERDAIGAEVQIQVGQQRWTGWQTGGDGYMCSNEAVVHFGVDRAEVIDELTVRWPDGSTQVWRDVKTNARYLLIQDDHSLGNRESSPSTIK